MSWWLITVCVEWALGFAVLGYCALKGNGKKVALCSFAMVEVDPEAAAEPIAEAKRSLVRSIERGRAQEAEWDST